MIEMNKKNTTFKHLFNNFLTSCKVKGLSSKTIETYKNHYKRICSYINLDIYVSELKEDDLNNLVLQLIESGISSNSIRSYLRSLNAFFSYCRDNNYALPRVPKYKAEETIKETYSDAELKILLRKPNLRTCSFEEYRNWVIINLLLDCGCRSSTVRNIQIRDIDLNNHVITYRHTKTRKVQLVPLSMHMCLVLAEYMEIRKGKETDYLFCTVKECQLTENALKKAIRKYNQSRGIIKTSTHLFRHTYARKYLLDCHGDAFTLQQILGHSTLDMTRHYCNIGYAWSV